MAKAEIGVIFRNYLAGDDEYGGERSPHTDRLYIGRNLIDIFGDILDISGIYRKLGLRYAAIYEAKLKGKPIGKAYNDELNREYNVLEFYFTQIKTGDCDLSDLEDIVFFGESDGERLAFYKVVEVIQDEQILKEREAEYKADGMLHRHLYYFD